MTRNTTSKALLAAVWSSLLPGPQLVASDITKPKLVILLNDTAHLPASTLRRTQAGAANVLLLAGVEIRWLACSFAEAERREPPGCTLPLDVPTITVSILSEREAHRWEVPGRALGFSMDQEVYLVLPMVQAVADRQRVPLWLVLAHVLTHEAGHALLGSGHSLHGIMRAEFGGTDWRRAEKGQLLFMSTDAHRLRDQIRRRTVQRMERKLP